MRARVTSAVVHRVKAVLGRYRNANRDIRAVLGVQGAGVVYPNMPVPGLDVSTSLHSVIEERN